MSFNLDNMLRAIHNSLIEAQKLTEQQHIRMIKRYFYIDEEKENISPEDLRKPKTMPLKLPYVNNENRIIYSEVEIPLISIIPPTSIKIKNMKIAFEAQISGFENQETKKKGFNLFGVLNRDKNNIEKKEESSHEGPLMLDLKDSRGIKDAGTMARIEIEFENGEQPEAVARINDQIIRTFPF